MAIKIARSSNVYYRSSGLNSLPTVRRNHVHPVIESVTNAFCASKIHVAKFIPPVYSATDMTGEELFKGNILPGKNVTEIGVWVLAQSHASANSVQVLLDYTNAKLIEEGLDTSAVDGYYEQPMHELLYTATISGIRATDEDPIEFYFGATYWASIRAFVIFDIRRDFLNPADYGFIDADAVNLDYSKILAINAAQVNFLKKFKRPLIMNYGDSLNNPIAMQSGVGTGKVNIFDGGAIGGDDITNATGYWCHTGPAIDDATTITLDIDVTAYCSVLGALGIKAFYGETAAVLSDITLTADTVITDSSSTLTVPPETDVLIVPYFAVDSGTGTCKLLSFKVSENHG